MSTKKPSLPRKSEPSEADAFTSMLDGLLAVSHDELKEAIEFKKANKKGLA